LLGAGTSLAALAGFSVASRGNKSLAKLTEPKYILVEDGGIVRELVAGDGGWHS